ncbi:hypothetical protein [Nocardia tengchongensis]|uniref:hypothetical protein n=1 Tax=Nocardia tengchongensis TaxID=2055889 RepID=UPI00365FC3A1
MAAPAAAGATFLAAAAATLPIGAFPVPGVPQDNMPIAPPADALPPGLVLPPGMALPSGPIRVPDEVLRHLMEWPLSLFAATFMVVGLVAAWFGGRTARWLPWSLAGFAVAVAAGTIDGGDTWIGLTRAGQGIAAAVMLVAGLAVLLASIEPERIVLAVPVWFTIAGTGLALGPYITVVVVGHWHWTANQELWVLASLAVVLAVAAVVSGVSNMSLGDEVNLFPYTAPFMLVAVAVVALELLWPSAHVPAIVTPIGYVLILAAVAAVSVWRLRLTPQLQD